MFQEHFFQTTFDSLDKVKNNLYNMLLDPLELYHSIFYTSSLLSEPLNENQRESSKPVAVLISNGFELYRHR